jgi:leucyl/phenylalanyl-tRNA--protein transferase
MARRRLTPELLALAYAEGYFPMPDPETGKLLWFNPDPRAVIPLDGFHVSHSLKRRLHKGDFKVTFDTAFIDVMRACADREETWITEEFVEAYTALHRMGKAHSVEVWEGKELVGGAYGVSIGGAFFAESKFHRARDASKVALYYLVERLKMRGFVLLEVQFLTPHLATLGAIEIPAIEYEKKLRAALRKKAKF